MNFKLNFDIAKSFLLARKNQTIVAAIGVTFSITMFITLLSFMTGLNGLLDGLILNRTPHIRLFNDVKPNVNQPINQAEGFKNKHNFISSIKAGNSRLALFNSEAIRKTLLADPRVLGVAAKVNSPVFFNDGAVNITGVVNGIDASAESRLFHFGDYIIKGSPLDISKIANSIILGKPLAEKLMAEIGDIVQITSAKGEIFPLRVVGYYQSGIQDFDKTQSFASIATVQKLLGQPSNYITDIQLKLIDLNQAPAVAKEYAQLFSTDAEDIQTANAQFETGSSIRTLISFAVGITLLVVAGFGIYNILNMMIYEKMDSIAILKATGFSGGDVKKIFLIIALSIGFFGGLLGLVFGFGLSALIDQVPFVTAALPTITTYPINYDPIYYIIATVFSLITTFFAGWLPSQKASKVDPVIIIRGK